MKPRPVGTNLILTLNTGSSSLKSAVYEVGDGDPTCVRTFDADRIGGKGGSHPNFSSAVSAMLADLDDGHHAQDIAAVGHRIVHGGAHHSAPERVSPALLADLRALFPIDPEHLPQAVSAIEAIAERLPDTPQVLCFDTHFHDSMPVEARMLPIPWRLASEGVRRFGFHGLSYESIVHQLAETDPVVARSRLVIAHLGAGASMVAVNDGKSLDTTMGFTPTGGLMMGTRPGDVDPGLLFYLLQVRKMEVEAVNRLLNKESGLLGVSGSSQDVRDLLAVEATDERARDALLLFCHIAKKHLAGLVAVLGGLDSLIFTGGIGEHSALIRSRIVEGLDFMGIAVDPARNAASDAVISPNDAPIAVRVMHTDEAFTVARHTANLIHS